MKLAKTFKSVNYIETTGDTYARWTQQGQRKPKDAVQLVVTDETGRVVYQTVVCKGGFRPTLAVCKAACESNYRMFGSN